MTTTHNTLLANHLAFLSTHRGVVSHTPDAVLVQSHLPGFSYAILDHPVAHLERFEAIHLHPGSEGLQPVAGFERQGAMVYMQLPTNAPRHPPAAPQGDPAWAVNEDLVVQRVTDPAALDVFTDVQARGFVPDPEVRPRWQAWLGAANQKNGPNPQQHFLLASQGGVPVGVTLVVLHEGTAGIYAVATPPEYRRQGIAATLLARALQIAGSSVVTLQVMAGSDAERLYTRLGFETVFTAPVWKRVKL